MDEPRQNWQVSLYLILEKPTGKTAAFVPADFIESFIDDIGKQKFPDFWEFFLVTPLTPSSCFAECFNLKKQGLLTAFEEV